MRSIVPVTALTLAGTALLGTLAASAQSPNAAEAARKATQQAKQFIYTLEQRHGSGIAGTVMLKPVGNKTQVTVMMSSPMHGNPTLTLHSGTDCIDNRGATAADIALAPMNAAAENAPHSQTIINLPIEQVRRNYVVDVRNATERARLAQACARLNP
ncbi:MAG TPA: hypothetical protein VE591_06135 [Candidatus Acidoferrum sp.]|jgi:hypothetical protein|nr:hypothetical protein [Candidatus Acidoferrum sp.]